MDLVYPPVTIAARTIFRLMDLRITVTGGERVPRRGGALLVSNHVSFLDFIFVGLAARESRRRVRFMAKQEVFAHRISGPLMRGMHHISVDRDAGLASFAVAIDALRAGEVVGIFPEATISRSYTVKPIKSGAVRLAQRAEAPLLPVALWGGQRIMTKGHPRDLTRHRPISIAVGEPMHPGPRDDAVRLTAQLRTTMQALLEGLQRGHPDQPVPGEPAPWHPAHLGGTAPTPEEALLLDRAERKAKIAEKRAARGL